LVQLTLPAPAKDSVMADDDDDDAATTPLPPLRSLSPTAEAPAPAACPEAPAPPPTKKSYLPAWLLESQKSLDAVEASQGEARAGIARLRTNLRCFDAMVRARDAPAPAPAPEALPVVPQRGPHTIDDDCATYVCQFLEGESLLLYARCSSQAKTWLIESVGDVVWQSLHARDGLDRCPWLDEEGHEEETTRCRRRVLRSAAVAALAMKFVEEFGADAASRRRADIAPRTLGASLRRRGEVTHPLPGAGAFSGDVVARVHSLGAEGRRRALPALEACALCACAYWSVGASRLVDAGGVALFVAFLSNELGALRGLAAATLANLVCTPLQDQVLQQLRACDARRPLVSLLSSPTARVALHIPSRPFAHLAARSPAQRLRYAAANTADLRRRERDSFCQAPGCRAAARALTNFILPNLCVALAPDGFAVEDGSPFLATNRWEFYCHHSSGSLRDVAPIALEIDGNEIVGTGADSLGDFSVRGTATRDRLGAKVLHFSKTYGTEFEARAGRAGHVAHVLWAGAAPAEGYFGVWEVTSSDAHFELRRGGPCRLVPLDGGARSLLPPAHRLPPIAGPGQFVG